MTTRPRVLVLAPIRPAQSGNGLAMRVSLFVEAAERVADVDVLVVPVAGEPPGHATPLGASTRLHHVPAQVGVALSLIRRIPAHERVEAFRAYGVPSLSGCLPPAAHERIAGLAIGRSFDLVVVLRAYMLPLLERIGDATIVVLDLDEDDLGSAVSQARIATARGEFTRTAWLMAEAEAIERLIARHQPRLARSFISCEADAHALVRRHPDLRPQVVHNAVALPRAPKRRHDGRTILFVGAFGHLANVDGIEWFVERVVPRIDARDRRGFELIIAGAGPPQRVLRLSSRPRVALRPSFDDAASLYARATIAIAPMRFGGGARTKIIEAAAHEVACVSHEASVNTMLAGAGWTAGNAADFASTCSAALRDPNGRRKRERAGRRIVSLVNDRNVVIAKLSRTLAVSLPV